MTKTQKSIKKSGGAFPSNKEEKLPLPVSLIKTELKETRDIFLKLHNIQLAMNYIIVHLVNEIEEDRNISPDILFGIGSILEWSAQTAHESAVHAAAFEMRFLSEQS